MLAVLVTFPAAEPQRGTDGAERTRIEARRRSQSAKHELAFAIRVQFKTQTVGELAAMRMTRQAAIDGVARQFRTVLDGADVQARPPGEILHDVARRPSLVEGGRAELHQGVHPAEGDH